ncbi:MAG: transcriptional regulator [Elusimicrobia bacterium RIFCSPLOWO2_12_FULL_59_9]|nr:MAG: transcriptional regulator [Elusimicrobia bacterium RIFCSPLOWO2_12_FULL_59_9]
MIAGLEQLKTLLGGMEGENLEFKEAKNRFGFDELSRYCVALANEGGGKIVLGVSDTRPRKVVGTKAFEQLERTRAGLMQKVPLRIEAGEVGHSDGRVLIFEVPSRPLGTAIKVDGIYWMRHADGLVAMSEEKLRLIFAETGRDFSAEICPKAGMADLSTQAIEDFRKRWIEKSENKALERLSRVQLLRDAEALSEDGLTYAALVLFGTREALGRYLAQAEVVFEYRSSEASGPAQQRKDLRQGFFSFYDDLWNTIALRNDKQHYEEGMFIHDILTFDERAVREAILNAVSHRDYQLGGSVFVRQYHRRLVIESPGGFPLGVNADNVLDKQAPRNRRIADTLTKCGLVERSGQGMNLIFERSIEQGKPLPDFSGTDAHQVKLTLHGQVQDPNFVRFLEVVAREAHQSFSTQDLLALDCVHREVKVPPALGRRLNSLVETGVVERLGRGRGVRLILSRRFYAMVGKRGVYTRKKGLDRETNKELLARHIQENAKEGSQLRELMQVLPGLSQSQVQKLLRELKVAGRIRSEGATRAGRWFPIA